MARQKTSSEREIQAATMQALATFFDREKVVYRHLDPANSSQGEKPNQFYGDLVSVIGEGHFLMIEFKALNHHNGELMAWDDYQYQVALSAEDAGIPIIYCYDFEKPLAYYESPQNWKTWPTKTLMGVKASVPSDLSSQVPRILKHVSLLEWLNAERKKPPSMVVDEFVKAVGYVTPTMLRNEIVFVLFSKEIALRFDGDAIPDFLDWLSKKNLKNGPNYKIIESLQLGLFPPPDPNVSTKPKKKPKV